MQRGGVDEDLLFRLQMDALHTEGVEQISLPRMAARGQRHLEAIDSYKVAESKFVEQMNSYEQRSPGLNRVRSTIEKSLDDGWDDESDVEITEMHARLIIMRFDEPYQPLSGEDLYRRAAANLYSSCAARCESGGASYSRTRWTSRRH